MAGPWEAYQSGAAPDSGDGPWKAYQAQSMEAPPTNDMDGLRTILKALVPGGQYVPDIAYGGKRALDAAAQLAARTAAKIAPNSDTLKSMLADTEAANAQTKAAEPVPIPGSSLAQGIVPGAVAALAAPEALGALGGGALAGGVASALEPVDKPGDYFAQKLKQAGIGAATGAAGGAVTKALGRVLSPEVGAAQQKLMDEGISMTPGQALGGIADKIESKATSILGLGDMIAKARMRGVDDLNRSVYTRALAPVIGDDAAAATAAKLPVGNDGIAAVGDKLSAAYEDALSKSSPAPLTSAFQGAISKLQSLVPSARESDFAKTMQRVVFDNVTPAGTLTPSVAKAADSELGRLARQYAGTDDADSRIYSQALAQARSELKQMFADANPATAPMIQAADQGWATLTQLENAGAMLGSKEGIVGPAQLRNAVKRSDTSVRDRRFARGEALNQDLADAAANVLPSKVPDSGTAGRVLQGAALGPGAIAAAFTNLPATLTAAAGLGAAALPYTRIGGKLTLAALAKRPDLLRRAGSTLADLAIPASALTAASLGP